MGAQLQQKGFTLVELTTVLVILGILSAIAIPRLVGGDAFSSRGFYDETRGIVRYAQKVAVAQRRTVFVTVTATGVAVCYAADCTSRVPSPVDSTDALGAHTDLTEGRWKNIDATRLNLSSVPVANFSFNGLGQPSSGVVITLTSAVPDDPTRIITVTTETGYVL